MPTIAASVRQEAQPIYNDTNCDVIIHDDVPMELEGTATALGVKLQGSTRHRISSSTYSSSTSTPNSQSFIEGIRHRLNNRDTTRTRWINIVGWSRSVVDLVTEFYPDCLDYLQLDNLSHQLIGGPIKNSQGSEIIWIQTQMWFIGNRLRSWDSLRSINFRMIVCLPSETPAGTLITNFAGPFRLADGVYTSCINDLLEYYSLGRQALGCVWILSFAMLRMMAEQVNFAFEIFDPANIISRTSRMPHLDELPGILEQSNNLGRISRYLSRLEEFTSFFLSVRELIQPAELRKPSVDDARPYRSDYLCRFATFEAERASQKIIHEHSMCKSYIAPFDNLIQMMISYSSTQIISRLDSGRRVGEQLSEIGITVAAMTGIVSPLSLITSFYGMNVREFTPEAVTTLYEFWRVGLPILLFSVVLSVFLGLWLFVDKRKA